MRWFTIIVLGLLALCCLVLTGKGIWDAVDFEVHAVHLSGVVSGHETRTCSRRDSRNRESQYTCYHSRVRYELGGVTRESLIEDSSSEKDGELGEAVDLRVDPRSATVYFAGVGPWGIPLFSSAFCLVFLASAIAVMKMRNF